MKLPKLYCTCIIILLVFFQFAFFFFFFSNTNEIFSPISIATQFVPVNDTRKICNNDFEKLFVNKTNSSISLWEKYETDWTSSSSILVAKQANGEILFDSKYRLEMYNKGYHPLVLASAIYRDRIETVYKFCAVFNSAFKNSFDINFGYDGVLFNDQFKFLQCSTPKVSSRYWIHVFIELAGLDLNKHKWLKVDDAVLWNKISLKFNLDDNNLTSKRLQTYTKFLIVRHPFAKLFSAYKEKLSQVYGNETWYIEHHAPIIIKMNYLNGIPHEEERFREEMLKKSLNLDEEQADFKLKQIRRLKVGAHNVNITFQEFLVYLTSSLDTGRRQSLDKHWGLYSYFCNPCAIRYDVIAKFESLNEDSSAILNYISKNLKKQVKIESNVNSTNIFASTEKCNEVFKKIPMWIKKKLYLTYKEDFLLFGYPYDDSLLEDNACTPSLPYTSL